MFINSKPAFLSNNLKWLSVVWTVCLIAPLIYFPGPASLGGHPWKVELSISLILFLYLIGSLYFLLKNKHAFVISPKIVFSIIIPFCAFIMWSAISAFWADSLLSVAHHTLVWTVYLIFFLFSLHIVSHKKLFKTSIISLGLVVSIICVSSIVEFSSVSQLLEFRYAKFAEIFAALLPLFFSYILRLNRKYLVWTILATVFLWLGILFSLSRGSLLSSVVGLSVFILFRIFTKKTPTEKRRLVFATFGIIFVAFLTQISIFSTNEQKISTFSRIEMQGENDPNKVSLNARLLFAKVGKEMFFANYLTGVGADNFGLEFNKYRTVFSANPENKSIANLQEEFLSERAHNEYLQILAELGITGGIIFIFLLGGMAKLGFAEIVKNRFARSNILTHSAIAGMSAFLVSSCFSSFSFRLMQNGLVFFFLLAILLRNTAAEKSREKQNNLIVSPQLSIHAKTDETGNAVILTASAAESSIKDRQTHAFERLRVHCRQDDGVPRSNLFLSECLKIVFVSIALIGCLSLIIFSGLKATSQYFVYQAEKQENFETAKSYYKSAILLDPANASANYSFGMRLFSEGDYEDSAAQLQQSVKKGANDSVSYSYLISAQTLANQSRQAINTASKAVEIFPYSVFLRVRYADLLNQSNKKSEAENQLAIAEQINKRQAETWRLLMNYGSLKASEESRANKEISSLDELTPNSGVYAILAEREIKFPEEKHTFKFNN